ncbi:MAG: trypsin-like peptidase domain-containing protein [Atopobiaceae bacterium]|nr:trypsin-like peptidase domain-containing protein [Atopobiaceae bacterium]
MRNSVYKNRNNTRKNTRQITRQTQRTRPHTALAGVVGGAVAGAAISAALVTALMGGVTGTTSTQQQTEPKNFNSAALNVTTASENTTISEAVAEKCLPSVVSVNVETPEGAGIGSGVVLDTDGNIITNWHVAGDATSISVVIDGVTYDATLVGGDPSSDIAVIRADLNGALVTPMEIGDSSALVVGDWVMTLGSPLGLDQSVSTGIVSALYRNQLMPSASGNTLYTNLIQVDAAINGGNSGGALVNDQGQLVGINSLLADASGTGSFSGIGFAIPGNYAVEIANKVIAGEPVTHAYIGLSCATVNEQNAQGNNLPTDQGAYVAELADGGPAQAAGIQEGDIITRIGDLEVTSADSLLLGVRSYSVGDTVEVNFLRNGEQHTAEVTLGSDERLQAQQAQVQQEHMQQQELEQQQMEEYQQFLEQFLGR